MKRSEKPHVTIAVTDAAGSVEVKRPANIPHHTIALASMPCRILVPRGCKAEIFSVDQGTEIRIRMSSKVKQPEPES
jgi:signal transduction histidine kinase